MRSPNDFSYVDPVVEHDLSSLSRSERLTSPKSIHIAHEWCVEMVASLELLVY